MRKPLRVVIALAAVAVVALMLAVPFYSTTASAINETRAGETITYTVGGQDQMKTRNWLPAIANDVWTSDVLGRVYDTVGQTHPTTDALVPYIIKGVDDNGDEVFQRSEKADFLKRDCPVPCADPVTWRRTVVAYYDFNGVFFHDGVQADLSDVMFNYVLQSLNPRFNTDLRVLWDDPNAATLPANRHLNIDILGCNLPDGPASPGWDGGGTMPGSNSLRCALRFRLQDDFALFYRSTLAGLTLFPRHEFEGVGGSPARHADFGVAIYPATWSVVSKRLTPVPADETAITPFVYSSAEGWQMTDADVIGTGPFKFGTWQITNAIARVDKNTRFFYGANPDNPAVVYDTSLPVYMHQPYVTTIIFKKYGTTQLGVLALQSGDIDFYHWALPPEFVPNLLNNPSMRVWANAEPGFFYMAYNMRRQPFGYTTWPPPAGQDRSPTVDTGLPFRQAFAHLIDKATIVRVLLQNYGVIADGTVSPSNTFWYNGTLPKYAYDPTQAGLILDNQGWTKPNGAAVCGEDGSNCRSFPRVGATKFEILTPQADYDPIRASAGAMIASAARSIGVNVVSKPTAFGTIVSRTAAGDFDMFILGWRIGGTDPDYLFSFFHSSNAVGGQNYPGFYDSEFDQKISASRKELNEATRQGLVKEAQGILAQRLPYDVLYYRTNIEAERRDRFENYSVTSGSIWNYWSIQSIKRPTNKFIRPLVTATNALVAGGTTALTTTVRDQDGLAVQGATVRLSVPDGSGTFAGGSCTSGICSISGQTGSSGQYLAQYTAPTPAPSGNPDVSILMTATSSDPAVSIETRTVVVTIFAAGVPFLSLTPKLTTGDLVPTTQSLVFGVEVRDQDGNLAPNAAVSLTVPPGPTITPSSGTAAQMRSGVVFQAPATISGSQSVFTVTATATQAGSPTTSTTIPFTVVQLTSTFKCPDGTVVPAGTACPQGPLIPALDVLPILATIGAAAVVYGIIRSRKKGA